MPKFQKKDGQFVLKYIKKRRPSASRRPSMTGV
jgi:hypothetical protein